MEALDGLLKLPVFVQFRTGVELGRVRLAGGVANCSIDDQCRGGHLCAKRREWQPQRKSCKRNDLQWGGKSKAWSVVAMNVDHILHIIYLHSKCIPEMRGVPRRLSDPYELGSWDQLDRRFWRRQHPKSYSGLHLAPMVDLVTARRQIEKG